MKHELRKGAFVIRPRSTCHLLQTLCENSLAYTNMISLQNKVEDYDDDNFCFVQNLRSRSLSNVNIILTIKDRGYNHRIIFKSLHSKSCDKYRKYKCRDATALSLEEKSNFNRRRN